MKRMPFCFVFIFALSDCHIRDEDSDIPVRISEKEDIIIFKQKTYLDTEKNSAKKQEQWSDELGEMDWDSAKAKCESLRMRLPAVSEIQSVHKSEIASGWEQSWHWTYEETVSGKAYAVDVENGRAELNRKGNHCIARCIKTEKKPAERYSENSTLGKWSERMGVMNWDSAFKKCESSGMRLPSRTEIETAFNSGRIFFSEFEGGNWTAEHSYRTEEPYIFYVRDGNILLGSRKGSSSYGVRCIR